MGSYTLALWARSAGESQDSPRAIGTLPYTVTAGPVLSVTLSADKTSPQVAGTTITLTAAASNGVAPYQYKWWLFDGSG